MAVATFSQSVLPMVVAQEKGYFREEDLDVELILMTASVANMALIGGSVDFISSGPSVIGAIARGAPLKFVFICFNRPMHWLYAKPEIKDVSGTQGKKDRCQCGWLEHPFFSSRDFEARTGWTPLATSPSSVWERRRTATRRCRAGPLTQRILRRLLISKRRNRVCASSSLSSNRIIS